MKMKTTTKWIKGEEFESEHQGNRIKVDGNKKNGHGPKALLLSGLAGCTGIDVIGILNKMKVDFSDFSIEVETEQTEEHPKVFKDIQIIYRLKTAAGNLEKVKKAIDLSLDKYCGVSAMLKKNSAIGYTVQILN